MCDVQSTTFPRTPSSFIRKRTDIGSTISKGTAYEGIRHMHPKFLPILDVLVNKWKVFFGGLGKSAVNGFRL